MAFPQHRLRRLRSSVAIRALVTETRLHPHDLVAPLFAIEGKALVQPIASMPGQSRLSIDMLVREAAELAELGVPAILLFGVPESKAKRPDARGAHDPKGLVPRAVSAVKKALPQLLVITDVCVCEYTDHGHCGILGKDGQVDNDPTLKALARTAVAHANAGADWVAPSDMMDGRVAALRVALDQAKHPNVAILAYAAKFASAFYGPFRDAAASAPSFGDRRGHQMDPANGREAMREMQLDLDEGADALMVKPALAYLDVIAQAKARFDVPVAAYNVSAEYSMVAAAAEKGWVDAARMRDEILTSIKRAGADIIISYHAKEFAKDFRRRKGLDAR